MSIKVICENCATVVEVDMKPAPPTREGANVWVDVLPDLKKLNEHLVTHA